MPVCPYCESSQLTLPFAGRSHPFKKDHGPFDIYRCKNCLSLITYPLPLLQEQVELYKSFKNGFIPSLGDLREKHSLRSWYEQCIRKAIKLLKQTPSTNTSFTWIDVGAGSGELSKTMSEKFPGSRGWAIDFHDRPVLLENISNVDWIKVDLNEKSFSERLNNLEVDLVISITVMEHVMYPDLFLKNLFLLMKANGACYLTVPCTNTITSRLLGSKWPYLIPGEHLTIPSIKGMKILLEKSVKDRNSSIHVKQTILPYTSGYYFSFLKLNFLNKIIPSSIPVRIPTGILEASIKS